MNKKEIKNYNFTEEQGMTCNQLLEKVAELKTKGKTDENILDIFFKAFTEGLIDAVELRMMAQAIGYDFSEDFIKELDKEGIKH